MPPSVPDQRFWAKLAADAWHPLSAHLADVAAVTECMLQPTSALASRLARASAPMEVATDHMRRMAVLLAFVHDVGKVQHGFQRRRDPSVQVVPSWRGHVRPVLDSISVPAVGSRITALAAAVGDPAAVWAAICHHGRPYMNRPPVGDARIYWHADGVRDPLAEWDRLVALAHAFVGQGAAFSPVAWTSSAVHLLAGIITLADWLGSSRRYFDLTPAADDDPIAYWTRARAQARTACEDVGLVARRVQMVTGPEGLARLFPATFPAATPTILQQQMAEGSLPAAGSRLLVESDTGSGKTEAALTLYARLRASGAVDSLYFALPTKATASAMLGRVRRFVQELYVGEQVPGVELAAGGRQAPASSAPMAVQYPDEPEAALLERWTSQSNRHRAAAEIVVGTVDQALLAALATKHSHLRLAGLARALIVVDEVHAYDRYMTTVLRHLTDLHTSLGGIVLFMSATLASVARQELGSQLVRSTETPAFDDAVARPYPSLSSLEHAGPAWAEMVLPASGSRTREVRWSTVTEEAGLAAALEAAGRGARVLVIRNTVSDARKTITSLSEQGGESMLWRPPTTTCPVAYHARYTRADRTLLDAAVLDDFGPGSTARGTILVSTQVAEQSLDVDFDLLVSDLAPVDVLIQRVGRVHRHVRADRAGHDTPSVLVIEPSTDLATLVSRRRTMSTRGHGTVYPDFGDLELTRRIVATRPLFVIPPESRLLVEAVYHPDRRTALAAEGEGWAAHLDRRDGDGIGATTHAEVCVVRFDLPYTDRENVVRYGGLEAAGGEAEAAVRTRLGDDRVSFTLPAPVPNAFAAGHPGDEQVDLDVRVLRRAGVGAAEVAGLCVSDWGVEDGTTRFMIGPVAVRYDSSGWHWSAR